MSRIDELIRELCPDGVPHRRLAEVARIRNGKDYKGLGEGAVPVFGTGGVMTTVDTAAHPGPSVLIPRKGSLHKLYYVEVPFWTVDTIFYTEIDDSQMAPKFLYYFLATQHLEDLNQAGGVPSLTQAVLNALRIPVPPLEVQREIVRVLDSFTTLEAQLEAELEAELEARRRQYSHYRDSLLTFPEGVRWATVAEVTTFLRTGLNPRTNFILNPPGANNYYATVRELDGNEVRFCERTDRIDDEAVRVINRRSRLRPGDVLVSGTGTIGRTALVTCEPVDWNIKEGVYALTPDQGLIAPKYLLWVLQAGPTRRRLLGAAMGSTVVSISMADLQRVRIPLPLLDEQERIVAILDEFDALVNNLSVSLAAELAARRKQYEYYRDRLLTFPEAAA